jgi:hypothetical protein
MAAEPIPMPETSTEVTINSDNSINGQVTVNNGGVVKFQVSSYPNDPQTGSPYNTCTVTISSSDISWSTSPAAGQNTIKVGN